MIAFFQINWTIFLRRNRKILNLKYLFMRELAELFSIYCRIVITLSTIILRSLILRPRNMKYNDKNVSKLGSSLN